MATGRRRDPCRVRDNGGTREKSTNKGRDKSHISLDIMEGHEAARMVCFVQSSLIFAARVGVRQVRVGINIDTVT